MTKLTSESESGPHVLPVETRVFSPGEERIWVPHDYCSAPGIFAATEQTCGREVTMLNSGRKYQIGGFHPVLDNEYPVALDYRHGKTMLVAVSFFDRFSGERVVRFSMREFCIAFANINSGTYNRRIRELMNDLTKTFIRVTDKDGKVLVTYRIFEQVYGSEKPIRRRDDRRVTNRQIEFWFSGIAFSAEFHALLCKSDELQSIRLDVLRTINNPLAQAAYWYIPAAASHHPPGGEPYEIGLAKLCNQVAFKLPTSKKHQLRLLEGCPGKALSLIDELDGKETNTGTLRASYREGKKGELILQFWVEPRRPPPEALEKMGEMKKAFLESGYTQAQMEKRLRGRKPLSSYQRGLLTNAKVDLDGSVFAFEIALVLLGECEFNTLISGVKHAVKEKRLIDGRPIENPTGYAIDACLRRIRESGPGQEPVQIQAVKPKPVQIRPVPTIQKPKAHAPKEAAWEEVKREFDSLSEQERAHYFELVEQRAGENEFWRKMLASGGERAEIQRLSMAIHIFTEDKQSKVSVLTLA